MMAFLFYTPFHPPIQNVKGDHGIKQKRDQAKKGSSKKVGEQFYA